jgi:hypothetical protein
MIPVFATMRPSKRRTKSLQNHRKSPLLFFPVTGYWLARTGSRQSARIAILSTNKPLIGRPFVRTRFAG